jgi:hypothetical protein
MLQNTEIMLTGEIHAYRIRGDFSYQRQTEPKFTCT